MTLDKQLVIQDNDKVVVLSRSGMRSRLALGQSAGMSWFCRPPAGYKLLISIIDAYDILCNGNNVHTLERS